jgi:hypothetical protein
LVLDPFIESFCKLFLYPVLNHSKLVLENGFPASKGGQLVPEDFSIYDNPYPQIAAIIISIAKGTLNMFLIS